MIFDAIVVGAGPAGAVLAYLLAKHGGAVLLLEKARLPRYKPCGGGVTMKAIAQLPFSIEPVVEVKPMGGILCFRGEERLRVEVPPVAWLVMRDRFDHFLVEKAVGAGVKVMDGMAVSSLEQESDLVRVRAGGETYLGRTAAGADGVTSSVGRALGLLPDRATGIALEAEIQASPEAMALRSKYATFDFGGLPYGYGWIFPKADHLSVGVFQSKPGKAPNFRQDLDRFISYYPELKDNPLMHIQAHHIPLGGDRSPLHSGRALLVGDAANLADPWLGEGISYAIASAHIAAQAITSLIEGKCRNLSAYTIRTHAEITSDLGRARTFATWVYRTPALGVKLITRSPIMQHIVFGVMRGDSTFQQFNRLLLRNLPRIAVDTFKK